MAEVRRDCVVHTMHVLFLELLRLFLIHPAAVLWPLRTMQTMEAGQARSGTPAKPSGQAKTTIFAASASTLQKKCMQVCI